MAGQDASVQSVQTMEDRLSQVLTVVMELKTEMGDMSQRMGRVERGDTGGDIESDPENQVDSDNETEPPRDNGDASDVTPDSLRRNVQIMARAAERLAQFGASQIATSEGLDFDFGRGRGKKSGSQLLASDAIQARIDWPHFCAKRMSAGRRKPVHYCDLKPEEFAHGFLGMLNGPKSKFDRELMLQLLENLMQDACDFGWENARDFYEMLGVDVERGQLSWDEVDTIHNLRMAYCRTVFPDKQGAKEGQRGQSCSALPGKRCCASYQRKV